MRPRAHLNGNTLEQWDSLLPRARKILGDIEVFADEATREISHPATGIQLSMFNDEVSITVPYWHDDDEAVEVMRKVYALAGAVEDETGLEGYDPQLEEAVSEVRKVPTPKDCGPMSPAPRTRTARRGAGPHPRRPRSATPRVTEPVAAGRPGHWWEFWKR